MINLLAPGNSARSYSEELRYYPSFSTLSTMDKLVQGYIQTANHFINNTTVLFSIIALISSYFIITDKKANRISKCVAILPILYVIAKITPFNAILGKVVSLDIDGIINYTLFGFEKFNFYTLYSKRVLIQLVSSSFMLLVVAAQLIYVFKTRKTGIITAILYLASICSALVMSFSPTIYASGNRVFMTTDFILIIISSLLSIKLFNKLNKKQNVMAYVLFVMLIILAAVFYINLYKNGTSVIIY